MTKQRKEEFKQHRASWKWFERKRLNLIHYRVKEEAALEFDLMLEILKELQYLNDRAANPKGSLT